MLFESHFTIAKEWADANGHMNMGYYLVALDMHSSDPFLASLGLGWAYLEKTQKSIFTLGTNLDYHQEAFVEDAITVKTQLLDWDYKRIHYIHMMHNASTQALLASNECLCMHINMTTRRSEAFSQETQQALEAMYQAHQTYPVPDYAFRTLGIRRRQS